jgi:hypothetical protein
MRTFAKGCAPSNPVRTFEGPLGPTPNRINRRTILCLCTLSLCNKTIEAESSRCTTLRFIGTGSGSTELAEVRAMPWQKKEPCL